MVNEIKIKIKDSRIAALLAFGEDTPYPMSPEEIALDALEKYFSRRDIKARFIAALLKKGVDEKMIKIMFPGDTRGTELAIEDARKLGNHLTEIVKKKEREK